MHVRVPPLYCVSRPLDTTARAHSSKRDSLIRCSRPKHRMETDLSTTPLTFSLPRASPTASHSPRESSAGDGRILQQEKAWRPRGRNTVFLSTHDSSPLLTSTPTNEELAPLHNSPSKRGAHLRPSPQWPSMELRHRGMAGPYRTTISPNPNTTPILKQTAMLHRNAR